MEHRDHFWKNIGFILLIVLLWATARLFQARVFHSPIDGFKAYDIAFIALPPIVAFFMNWYWMLEQRTDTIIKWSVSWAGANLGVLILTVLLLRDPVIALIEQIPVW